MTQPVQQQPAQQTATAQQVTAALAVLTAVLGGLSLAAAAGTLANVLHVRPSSALAALNVAVRDMPAQVLTGRASVRISQAEQTYRAAYLANATLRIDRRLDAGADVQRAVVVEMDLFRAHKAAQDNRARSAGLADRLAARFGAMLGWKATIDSKTSPECRAAHKHNFLIAQPPSIGLPGATHPHCRCIPTRPYLGAGLVNAAIAKLTHRGATEAA